jgi:nanoRNase/pAp phosphatase (c-di-AMP/oligoRNAs hydrolase)
MNRLVLGSDAVGQSFIDRLATRPGNLVVLTSDSERARSLRENGVNSRHVDITDVDDIRTVAGAVDSIVVAPSGLDELQAVVRAARTAYPDAFLLACVGDPPSKDERASIAEMADRIVELPVEVGRSFLERCDDTGIRTRKLRGVLDDIEGTLTIIMHDDPDPDAIGSAIGLERIATDIGLDAEACYYGEINHQENRALVNLFEFELRRLDPDTDPSSFDAVALVDHSQPGVNDGLPADTPIDIVIDHHPPREPIQARFVDLRSDVGATCTLVAGYLSQLGIRPDNSLASGLLYGIRTDTRGFNRGVSIADFEAAADLVELADGDRLRQVESPSISAETIDVLGAAIANRAVESNVLTTCVGAISDRDALSQAADRLLGMEDITTALVFGFTDETVIVSGRARGADHDLGEVLREAFGQIGSAGGHPDMAGAQIPTGILTEGMTSEDREDIISDVITERFLEALGIAPNNAAATAYPELLEADDDPSQG